ncbi:MAG: hypothetical protein COB02_17060 [Candidatus Cloacimonadota bacterium]|nr:MAG: hypothetical protein COB02_17060 [Candidatus Cloacimonadota bacterium]
MANKALSIEEELFFLKEQLAETEEIAKLGHWIYDVQEGKFWLSEQVKKILYISNDTNDFSIEELLNLIDEKDKNKFIDEVIRATDTGEGFFLEFRTTYIKNIPKIIYSRWKCKFDENNNVYQLFGIFQDITDQKILEEVLKRERLKADRANSAKSTFLSNMSHEIRTPMNAILGFSELLSGEIKNKVHKNYLKIILNSGRSLLKIINDILDLSKVESGKMSLEDGYFSLVNLIKETLSTFQLNSKKIKLISKFSKGFPKQIKLDKVRLRQVLINLISNALKFTNKGFIQINISYNKDSELSISVEDTGIGIEKSQIKKIFLAFEQTENQSFEKYGGTGLGLAITKQIVELMGGEINVESQLDKGSIFSVRIPDVKFKEEIEEQLMIESPIISDLSRFSVLIVDKDLSSKDLYEGFLKHTGIKISFSQSCKTVVKLILKNRFDIVLIDKKGFFIDEIAKLNFKDKIAIIQRPKLVLIDASLQSKSDLLLDGLSDYLLKPISQKNLIECFNKLLLINLTKPIKVEPTISRVITFPKEIQENFLISIDGLVVDELEELIQKTIFDYSNDKVIIKWCEELTSALSMFDIERVEELIREIKVSKTV